MKFNAPAFKTLESNFRNNRRYSSNEPEFLILQFIILMKFYGQSFSFLVS